MSTENAAREDPADIGGNDAELDSAIDELRGVLRKGGEAPGGTSGGDRGSEGFGAAGPAFESNGFEDMSASSAEAFADFGENPRTEGVTSRAGADPRLDLVMDIPIDVQIVLGTSRMPVSGLLNLSQGSTIPLDRRIGEPVEITVNGRVIGRGEITVLEGDESRFGVRLLELDTDKG